MSFSCKKKCTWFLLLLGSCALFVFNYGCSTLKDTISTYQACLDDPTCVQDIENFKSNDVVNTILFSVLSLIGGIYGVNKFKKRNTMR